MFWTAKIKQVASAYWDEAKNLKISMTGRCAICMWYFSDWSASKTQLDNTDGWLWKKEWTGNNLELILKKHSKEIYKSRKPSKFSDWEYGEDSYFQPVNHIQRRHEQQWTTHIWCFRWSSNQQWGWTTSFHIFTKIITNILSFKS